MESVQAPDGAGRCDLRSSLVRRHHFASSSGFYSTWILTQQPALFAQCVPACELLFMTRIGLSLPVVGVRDLVQPPYVSLEPFFRCLNYAEIWGSVEERKGGRKRRRRSARVWLR